MIYLLYGPDEFSRSEMVADLRAQIAPDLRDLNTTTLDGRKLKLDVLARACEAIPFLAEHRLVLVSDLLKHTKAGKPREELRDYLAHVPPTCLLVLVERETLDKRHTVYTALKKSPQATLHEFLPREGAALLGWLDERARAVHARLDPEAARLLVDYCGNDSRMLTTELAKLAHYVGQGGTIAPAAVALLTEDNQEHNLFAFIDDLSRRNPDKALRGLRELLADGQAPTYLLFMLTRQVRILLGVQELAAQRMRPNDIASELRQKPFVVRKALEHVRTFARAELITLHDRLLATDQAIKTGRLPAEVGLELLVLEFCRAGAPRRQGRT